MKICLVCSSGGHLFALYFLKDYWLKYTRFWVTFPTLDTKSLLTGEKIYPAFYPTNRNILNLFRNFLLAARIFFVEKPDIVITSGAGVGVAFIIIAKFFRIKTVYIESLTRISDISLSGKLSYPFVNHFLVQWPELAKKYAKAKFVGTNI